MTSPAPRDRGRSVLVALWMVASWAVFLLLNLDGIITVVGRLRR